MTDDRLPDVRTEGQAAPAADVGCEPSDRSAWLRRERRNELARGGLVVLAGAVFLTAPPTPG